MEQKNSLISRLLAFLALALAAVVSLAVIFSATGDGDTDPTPKKKNAAAKKQDQGKKNRPKQKTYEVSEGDSLIGISEKTGVPMEKIEKLNPDLDPQALTLGQKIKLR